MGNSYVPLKRDRTTELQRLADRVGVLVRAGGDAVMLDDVYRRMARDWERVPPTGVEDLEGLQAAILQHIAGGEDPDERMRAYHYHARELQHAYQREIAVRDAEAAPPSPPRSAGRAAAQLGVGFVAGWYATEIVFKFLSQLLRPFVTMTKLLK